MFSDLKNKTIKYINIEDDLDNKSNKVTFVIDNNEVYQINREQDCWEEVFLDDIAGDIKDIIGSPLTNAEVVIQNITKGDITFINGVEFNKHSEEVQKYIRVETFFSMQDFDIISDTASTNLKDLIANDEKISESDINDIVRDIYNKNILDLTEKEFNTLDNCATHLRWTYFKLDTAKGGVNLRFIGSSNGYYSINMDFKKLEGDEALMYIEMAKNEKIKKIRNKPSIH